MGWGADEGKGRDEEEGWGIGEGVKGNEGERGGGSTRAGGVEGGEQQSCIMERRDVGTISTALCDRRGEGGGAEGKGE